MIKKTFYWFFTAIQILSLVSAYGIHYFTTTRMGMMRYVVFINQEWERQYPIALLQHAAGTFFILIAMITLIMYQIKKRNGDILGKKAILRLLFQIGFTLLFVVFTFSYSTEKLLSYYFTDLNLAIVVLLQNFKVLLYIKR